MAEMTELLRTVFAKALRWLLVLMVALAIVSVLLGYLLAGKAGLWGAVFGLVAVALFSGTTVGSMLISARLSAKKLAVVVLGSWLAKMIALIVMLSLIHDLDFYSKPVLVVVLMVGAFGSAAIDFLVVTRARVPYVSPSSENNDAVC